MNAPTPEDIVQAHKFLYYVLATPVWSDAQYDAYCREHGVSSKGGSDVASHYPINIQQLAQSLLRPVRK